MSASQVGTFRHGMFGYPVETTLSDTPIALAGAIAVNLIIKRPFEVDYEIDRDLDLPGCILDAVNGVIKWDVEDGDFPSVGAYQFVLTIDYDTPESRLIVDGVIRVS